MKPTAEQISKLPQWAIKHIESLERQRDEAVRVLNASLDGQAESSIYYEDYACTGETSGPSSKRVYIQSNQITCVHAGIKLRVFLPPEKDGQRLFGPEITYGYQNHNLGWFPAVCLRSPSSLQIVSKENMR